MSAVMAIGFNEMQISRAETIESIADERLERWARFMNSGGPVGPAPVRCNLGRVQTERVAAGNQGTRRPIPREVEEIEIIVCTLGARGRKLIDTYYMDRTPMYIKARDCGLTPNGYWRAVKRIQRQVYNLLP